MRACRGPGGQDPAGRSGARRPCDRGARLYRRCRSRRAGRSLCRPGAGDRGLRLGAGAGAAAGNSGAVAAKTVGIKAITFNFETIQGKIYIAGITTRPDLLDEMIFALKNIKGVNEIVNYVIIADKE